LILQQIYKIASISYLCVKKALEKYLAIDKFLFLFVQEYLHHPILDMLMPLIRHKLIWIPLYLFILYYSFHWGRRVFLKYLFFLIVLISTTDLLNSRILKAIFHRIRPCNDVQINALFEPLIPCGSGFSFPSSHAVNHFALAVFFYLTAHFIPANWRFIWFVWAFLIAFAQVYVGVHYPLDVFIGGIIGLCFGNIVAKMYLCTLNKETEQKG
jgi:undecaprenyl-diphosphatase